MKKYMAFFDRCIRTRDIPDPHGDIPLPNFAEIESNCGYNVFTPLQRESELVFD